jgi:hypothetical protein
LPAHFSGDLVYKILPKTPGVVKWQRRRVERLQADKDVMLAAAKELNKEDLNSVKKLRNV